MKVFQKQLYFIQITKVIDRTGVLVIGTTEFIRQGYCSTPRATNHPSHIVLWLSMNVSVGNMCTVFNLQGIMSISYNNILICVTTSTIIKIQNVSALLATHL
jgi:hypothetical protein